MSLRLNLKFRSAGDLRPGASGRMMKSARRSGAGFFLNFACSTRPRFAGIAQTLRICSV
jgi:hypothetical protein